MVDTLWADIPNAFYGASYFVLDFSDYQLQRAINTTATSLLESEGASTSIDDKQIILHVSCFGLTASSGTDCVFTKNCYRK